VTAAELRTLGLPGVSTTPGGVEFGGGREALWRANLELRTAGRVLERIGSFRAAGFDELRRRAARLPWERFLTRGDALALRVACHKSRLYHSGGVAERVAQAVTERLGFSPERLRAAGDEAEPEAEAVAALDGGAAPASAVGARTAAGPRVQLVLVRLDHDRCSVSVDASGDLLHRRGYREATGKAPLRETLAASLLLVAGWDARSPLLDPFCGAGTIPIEAALLAHRRAPGRARGFAFLHWSDFDAVRYAALVAAADARAEAAPAPPPILASDRDAGAVAAAAANARRAGVASDLALSQRTLSDVAPPAGPGFVVTNPPHGVRLSRGRDLRDLYARFGAVMRARCPGWHVALLSPGPRLWNATGLALEPRLRVLHGGLRLALVTGVVPVSA
jgi:putative N6-adenine-specific DNA methylase